MSPSNDAKRFCEDIALHHEGLSILHDMLVDDAGREEDMTLRAIASSALEAYSLVLVRSSPFPSSPRRTTDISTFLGR